MIRRLVVTYVVITALGLALLAIPLGITFAHREQSRLLFDIERDADTMTVVAERYVASGKPFVSSDITRYSNRTGGHVVVTDAHGNALLDTEHVGEPPRNYSSRPEIAQALAGKHVDGTRNSETLGTSLLYVSVPVAANGRVNGALRITYPTATLDARVRRMWMSLALLCVGVLTAVAIVGFVFARSITRPIRRLEDAADRFAAGNLGVRVEGDIGGAPPELRRLAETFNRMAARLEHLIGAQQHFVADASHQLRTPLTALRLRLENMEAGAAGGERASFEAAAAEVARMSRLVDGLLVLARGADPEASVSVDVASIARERADMWSDVAHEHGVTVDIDAPASAWAAAAPGAVEQLVDNLVDNALNVSAAGGAVVVRVVPAGDLVELHVVDNGPGLDAEARRRAFDRFWRAPDAAPGGSGLGLAIVRQLAETSGGSARLDAHEPRGVDAVVVLAAAPAPVPERQPVVAPG